MQQTAPEAGSAAGGAAGAATAAPADGWAAAGAASAGAVGGAAGSPGTASAGQSATGSALKQGAGAQQGDSYEWIPEKYRVVSEDKKVDLVASARKLAEGYSELVKRLGSSELPPKDVDGYDLKPDGLPPELKLDELKKDPEFQAFLKSAHGKGMTNAQVQFVMQEFYSRASKLMNGSRALDTEAAIKQLREVWKDSNAYTDNMKAAYKATTALAAKAGLSYDDIEAAGLGDNPTFIRVMAALGGEIGEAPLPGAATSMPAAADINDLLNKLRDPKLDKDPQRAEWQRKVDAYYARQPGAATPVF